MAAYVIYPTDEQQKVVKAFLDALEISFVTNDSEELPSHVLKGIKQGEADYEAGEYTSLDDFKAKLHMFK